MGNIVRLKITLAYMGTSFAGWQIQAGRADRTVQACLEQGLTRLAGVPVRAQGASRTDAGVHALHQVAHADVPAERAHLPWQRALNAILPKDMTVLEVCQVSRDFHARYNATGKTYAYTLWHEPGYVLPQRRPFVWAVGPLDLAAMEEAAQELIGRHDFRAFQNQGTPVKNTVRQVWAIECGPGAFPQETLWRVSGAGFLKQMVRNIMGCLVEAGRGKVSSSDVRSLLMRGDRTLAPATAPARGLCLEHMEFDGSERPADQPNAGRPGPDDREGGPDPSHRPGDPGGSHSRRRESVRPSPAQPDPARAPGGDGQA